MSSGRLCGGACSRLWFSRCYGAVKVSSTNFAGSSNKGDGGTAKSTNKMARRRLRRRATVSTSLLVIVFIGLDRAAGLLQVIQGERYTFLSENNRIRIKRVPGTRGMIYDRHGELLVDSRPSFDLLFVPEDTEEPENTLRLLARTYLKWDENELLQTYRRQ